MIRKLSALLLSLFVATALVACGDDDADEDASGSGSASVAEEETTTTTEGGGGDDEETTTTEGGEAPQASGDFCEQAEVLSSDTSLGELDFSDPADVAIGVGLLEDFRDSAPEEIKDDLQIIIDGFQRVATALAEAGDDQAARAAVAEEMADELQALQTASTEVQVFTQEACGIDISGTNAEG